MQKEIKEKLEFAQSNEYHADYKDIYKEVQSLLDELAMLLPQYKSAADTPKNCALLSVITIFIRFRTSMLETIEVPGFDRFLSDSVIFEWFNSKFARFLFSAYSINQRKIKEWIRADDIKLLPKIEEIDRLS